MSDMKLNIVESWQIDPQAGPNGEHRRRAPFATDMVKPRGLAFVP